METRYLFIRINPLPVGWGHPALLSIYGLQKQLLILVVSSQLLELMEGGKREPLNTSIFTRNKGRKFVCSNSRKSTEYHSFTERGGCSLTASECLLLLNIEIS